MGQKVNPIGLRLGVTEDWRSRWYAGKRTYAQQLKEDIDIRTHITDKLKRAGISRVEIERFGDRVRIDIFTARPGIVIGKRGAEVDELRSMLEKSTGKQVQVNIQEIKRPELDAVLVAQNVADQLEARVSFRRAMKKAVQLAMKSSAKGIRIQCSGRLGGSEMSRSEWYREGRVPLHTLRADIDYGLAESLTTFGRIGVKVWIYKGEIMSPAEVRERRAERERAAKGEGKGPREDRPRREGEKTAGRRSAPVQKGAAEAEMKAPQGAGEMGADAPEKPVAGTESTSAKTEEAAKVARTEKAAKPDKPEKAAKSPKAEKAGKPEKPEKADKPDKAGKAEKPEQPEKSDKSERAVVETSGEA